MRACPPNGKSIPCLSRGVKWPAARPEIEATAVQTSTSLQKLRHSINTAYDIIIERMSKTMTYAE